MIWPEFLQVSRIRAIEESDSETCVWDRDTLREVNVEMAKAAGGDSERFLSNRASWLAARVKVASIVPALSCQELPSWLGTTGWLMAFIAGWWLAALGQESEINLLALPLIGILVWNGGVVMLSVLTSFSKDKTSSVAQIIEHWLQRFGGPAVSGASDTSLEAASRRRFRELTQSVWLRHFSCSFKAWLHLGAALLALGSISGMYARGWSKEYRAVWESTLLDEAGAQLFLGTLFTPAAKVTGMVIPKEQLPEMRRRPENVVSRSGPALPWIHLYATTLGLFVMIPRGFLVLLELNRAQRTSRQVLKDEDWQSYVERLLACAEGEGAVVEILTYGLPLSDESQDRWRLWAKKQWRDIGRAEFCAVPVGGEADFVKDWQPSTTRVLIIFNLAGTPEVEVHRWLAEALLERKSRSMMLLALDETELIKRWAGFADARQRLTERENSWRQMMRGLALSFLEIDKRNAV